MSDATITTRPIVSTVVAPGRVAATVQTVTTPAATVTGGVGATGPQGPAPETLDQIGDVVAPSPTEGEVLRYINGAWRDQPGGVNGGNF